jgi:hypothetical protein
MTLFVETAMSDEEPTVDVRGLDTEVNANDLLEAAQAVAEQPDGEGATQSGDVIVFDDECDDSDCYVIYVGDGWSSLTTPRKLMSNAEDAIDTQQSFIEYVKQNTEEWDYSCEVGEKVKNTHASGFGVGYDYLLWRDYGMKRDRFDSFDNLEGVEVGFMKPVDDGIMYGLDDCRDE